MYGDLSMKGNFSNVLKNADISVKRYSEVTGWDRRSIVQWCKNGVPVNMARAVYETFRLWNALICFPKNGFKELPYTKKKAPNMLNTLRKYEPEFRTF